MEESKKDPSFPSICIPKTLHNVKWVQVKEIFELVLGKGTVDRVDIVQTKNPSDVYQFCRIFIHFKTWSSKPEIQAIRDKLIKGETIKVVYDNPWFWKCVASNVPKPDRTLPKTPFIEFEKDDLIIKHYQSDSLQKNIKPIEFKPNKSKKYEKILSDNQLSDNEDSHNKHSDNQHSDNQHSDNEDSDN